MDLDTNTDLSLDNYINPIFIKIPKVLIGRKKASLINVVEKTKGFCC